MLGPSGWTSVRQPRWATFHTDSPWISSHTRTHGIEDGGAFEFERPPVHSYALHGISPLTNGLPASFGSAGFPAWLRAASGTHPKDRFGSAGWLLHINEGRPGGHMLIVEELSAWGSPEP